MWQRKSVSSVCGSDGGGGCHNKTTINGEDGSDVMDAYSLCSSTSTIGGLTPLGGCCMPQLQSRPSSATTSEETSSSDGGKQKKHVSFRADKDLVCVREIPRRGDSPLSQELEPCDPDQLIEDWGCVYGSLGGVRVESITRNTPPDVTVINHPSKIKQNTRISKHSLHHSRRLRETAIESGGHLKKDSTADRKMIVDRSKSKPVVKHQYHSTNQPHHHSQKVCGPTEKTSTRKQPDQHHKVTTSLVPFDSHRSRDMLLENGRKVKVVPNMTNKGLIELLSNNKHRNSQGARNYVKVNINGKVEFADESSLNSVTAKDSSTMKTCLPRLHPSPYRQSCSSGPGKPSHHSTLPVQSTSDSGTGTVTPSPRPNGHAQHVTRVTVTNSPRDTTMISPQSWTVRPSGDSDVQVCTRRLYAWHMANNSCTQMMDTPCISQMWESTVSPS